MFRNKLLGIAAAATLGSAAMLGSTSAYALKILNTPPNDRAGVEAGMDSVTYASETLMTNATTEVKGDSTTYYDVGGTGSLTLSLPADVGSTSGDAYIVSVALEGMVFRTALSTASLTGTSGVAGFTIATGGAVGDKMVVFRSTTSAIVATTGVINLTGQFAVADGGGSATVTLTNQTLAGLGISGVSGTKTHGPAKVIKTASALKETSMASDLTASVASSFKKFKMEGGDVTLGHVGSVVIGINGHRIATTGDGTNPVTGLEAIAVTGSTTDTPAVPNSTVSFSGDFSFASKVFVHGDGDCGVEGDTPGQSTAPDTTLFSDDTANPDIRVMEGTGDDAVVTGTTKAVSLDNDADGTNALASFTGYLCIMVQGDDTDDMDAPRIPNTDAYTAMGSYKALANAASGPMGMERMLGEINRDGTTVRIPYVTTYSGYNQRLVLVNRGPEARYEVSFVPEDGITANPEMMEGMLPKGTTMMLTRDMVTLTGGSRTAATVIVEANGDNIDVATVTVNNSDGSSDTVTYAEE